MYRAFVTLLALCWAAVALGDDSSSVKFPSPDGRFALRITEPNENESADLKIELIEKASGKVMFDLGTAYRNHLSETVLVWSADSKWAAYGTRDNKHGETSVYFWDGSAFQEVPLPDDMPEPHVKFRKSGSGHVKNYGEAVKPLRWLKSGGLELSSDSMLLRDDGTYTGIVVITLAFDAQHHASVQKVGKTKTQVDE